jgi:hypothetical protein
MLTERSVPNAAIKGTRQMDIEIDRFQMPRLRRLHQDLDRLIDGE